MSLVMNSAINIAALSLTAGLFAADYVYDNHWFNYLFEDSSVLKSRVVASVR